MLEENQKGEFDIDLKELLFEVLSHWKMIMLSTVLVAVIGYLISRFIITPQYQSTSELYVLSQTNNITSLADIQLGSNLTNDYIIIVKERPVVEQVIENLGLHETYRSLRNKITLENPAGSRILKITVTDPDAKRAKLIADEMAEVARNFISEKMNQDMPKIISQGYYDGAPVSPNILKNTLIGAMVGTFLSVLIVVITYLLDDSIMSPDDLEKKVGINVLGSLPYEWWDKEADAGKGKRKRKSKG